MSAEIITFAVSDGSARISVNYAINRRRRRGGFEHSSGKLVITGDWRSEKTQAGIFRKIVALHPGWMVTGWALADTPNEKGQP